MEPRFFESSADLRAWLAENHASENVLWVGFHKKATGRPSIDWPELVDELLCFGWIDGRRKSIDAERWMIRITPRRPNSRWSETNRRRFGELLAEGRIRPAGREAHRRWEALAAGAAASAQDAANESLDPAFEDLVRADSAAWEYFQSETEPYRRTAIRWVMSAKRQETRLRRLATLIADSAAGQRIPPMRR
jgi:uncharacterized protein YdeI (YjbR/CyaY-like superfamily)